MVFLVPSEAVPSLIGLSGGNIRDTERVTGTRINYKRDRQGSSKVIISGPPEGRELARKIIVMSVEHFKCSVAAPLEAGQVQPTKDDAFTDIKTFYAEVR